MWLAGGPIGHVKLNDVLKSFSLILSPLMAF